MMFQNGASKFAALTCTILVFTLWYPVYSTSKKDTNEAILEAPPQVEIENIDLISPTSTRNEADRTLKEMHVRSVRNVESVTETEANTGPTTTLKTPDKFVVGLPTTTEVPADDNSTQTTPERFNMNSFMLVSVPTVCSLIFLMFCCIFCTRSGSCLCPQ